LFAVSSLTPIVRNLVSTCAFITQGLTCLSNSSCISAVYFSYPVVTLHIPGHKNWVLCIAWSPDGKHLVSGSKSGELILWDPKTGKQLGSPLTVL
jgi:WD40 repeat protein